MVAERLRAVLERGAGVGELDGDHVTTGFAEHPICGDRIELSVRACDGVVQSVRWRASGCPASMAVAALASEVFVDVAEHCLEQVLHDAISAHGGLQRHEQHAKAMVLRAIQQALGS